DPQPATAVGARGRRFARDLQQAMPFAQMLERILATAAARQGIASMAPQSEDGAAGDSGEDRFPLTRLAEAAIDRAADGGRSAAAATNPAIDLARAREVLSMLQRRIAKAETRLDPFVPGVEIEIAIAVAENEAAPLNPAETRDPLFRLYIRRW